MLEVLSALLGFGYRGRGLQFGMPPLGTRPQFLCKVFWFVGLMSLALKAGY